jgi:hypothetical protein
MPANQPIVKNDREPMVILAWISVAALLVQLIGAVYYKELKHPYKIMNYGDLFK